MLLEFFPEAELEPWKPHPHGWSRPPGQMPFKNELVKVEPMKAPTSLLLFATGDYEYGTEEGVL